VTLAGALDSLAAGVEAARRIGLSEEADGADDVLHRARERVGFPGDAYVLALAGGTGVGKSSLLNALAGRAVSAVRAVRPTTDEPIAWVAAARHDELRPLLEWLAVGEVAAHEDGTLRHVAVLDLPDVDSVRVEHRRLVDRLLPRIDAVAWVVDPEKYDDERLHAYLREMAIHARRMRFVFNKTDRLPDGTQHDVARDFERRLAESGIASPRIAMVSAASGEGIPALRAALAEEADAKALVAARLATEASQALRQLAAAAGLPPDGTYEPLVAAGRRQAALDEARAGALALVDPPGVARQAQAAVLARARRTGGGLLGRTVALLGRLAGTQRRRADPAAYLVAWRRRGTLGRVLNPIRALLVDAAREVPASGRPRLLATLGAERAEEAVADALDATARDLAPEAAPPGSLLWPVVGVLQLAAAAVLLFAVAWYLTLFLVPGTPVGSVDLPVLGPVPMPLALLAGALVVSALLGVLLSLHAGWLGRRFGRRVAALAGERVAAAIERVAFGGLDEVERGRAALAAALRRVHEEADLSPP
jgi:GTP-binding protein EngB required for normal cell division